MTPRSNLLWQFLGGGLSKAFIFLFYILLPLSIGVEEYGKLSFALATFFIVVQPILEMGLDMVIAKWVSRGRHGVLGQALVLRITAAFLAAPLALAASFILPLDRTVLFLLLPYFVVSALQNLLFAFFRGIEDMRREAFILPLEKCSALVLLPLLSLLGITRAPLGATALLCSVLIGAPILLATSRPYLRRAFSKGALTDILPYRDLLKEGVALGGVTFLWLIYFRVDSVMLGVMRGDLEVGIYNVAYKILEGLLFVPSTIMIVSFPKLAKRERFAEAFAALLFLLGLLGLAASAALYFIAPTLIRIVFGAAFSPSAAVLQTLSLALPPLFIGHLTTQSLVALDLNKRYLLVASLGAFLNILLNSLLIPWLGAVGAAWATVATEVCVTLLCGYFLWKARPDVLNISAQIAALKINL